MDIRLLGPLRVVVDDADGDRPVNLGGARTRTLLAALLLDRNRDVSTDRLADAIWGDDPPQRVDNALQARVSQLRKALGRDGPVGIVTVPGGYRLDVAEGVVDADRFEQQVALGTERLRGGDSASAASILTGALSEWRGRALGQLGDASFARAEAERLEELRLVAVERKLEAQLALGRPAEVVGEVAALIDQHPLRERLHGLRMTALYQMGRQAHALAAYDELRRRLRDELGIDPAAELQRLHRQILDQTLRAPAGAPSVPAAAAQSSNLPRPLTSFVGRRQEADDLAALVPKHRLVTLVGPGGTGKTRLAIEVARRLAAVHRVGAHLVELAPVGEPEAVLGHVAASLGLAPPVPLERRGGEQRSLLDRLTEHLVGRELIVVLDNCEHVVDAAADVVHLMLQVADTVRILATSREGLRVPGEVIWPVPPLAVPARDLDDPADLAAVDAVRLFLDRATSAMPAFALDDLTAAAVGEVCRRLDGLPLAIELAAARVSSLPVTVLADRLNNRFRLLAGGPRTATRRQQTLEAVVEWSYDLLDERQRTVFRRFGVFVGGCEPAAAEHVCADADVAVDEVLPTLAELVDKSLLSAVPHNGGVRYAMLETLREFALRRLVAAGDADATRDRHATWWCTFASEAHPQLWTAEQVAWLDRLEREHDNLRTALSWLAERQPIRAAELACQLAWFWWLHDHGTEAVRWLRQLVETPLPPPVRIRTDLWLQFHVSFVGGRPALHDTFDEQTEALAALDARLAAEAHMLAGFLATAVGDVDRAETHLRQADDTAVAAGIPWVVAVNHFLRSQLLLLRFDVDGAVAHAEAAGAEAARLGDRWLEFQAADWLASAARIRGDYHLSEQRIRRALELGDELGIREQVWFLRAELGMLEMLRGDFDEAQVRLRTVADEAVSARFPRPAAMACNGLGLLARRRGDAQGSEAAFREGLDLLRSYARDAAGGEVNVQPDAFEAELIAGLAFAAAAQGRGDEAEVLAADAADTAGGVVHAMTVALILEAAAEAALSRGDWRLAARRLGHASALRERAGVPLRAAERFDVARIERGVFELAAGDPVEPHLEAGRSAPTEDVLPST